MLHYKSYERASKQTESSIIIEIEKENKIILDFLISYVQVC